MNEFLTSAVAELAVVLVLVYMPLLAIEGMVVLWLQARRSRAATARRQRLAIVVARPVAPPEPAARSLADEVSRLREMEMAAMQRLDRIHRDAEARLRQVRR